MSLLKEFILNNKKIKDTDADIHHIKYVSEKLDFDDDSKIWFCFLYGLTYNSSSAFSLLSKFPIPKKIDINEVRAFFKDNFKAIQFDGDKIKCKPIAPDTIQDYINVIGKDVKGFLENYKDNTPFEVFDRIWGEFNELKGFGRFSKWNFLQALKWLGVLHSEPSNVLLGDGSDINFIEGLYYDLGHLNKLPKRIQGKKVYHILTQDEREFYEDYALKMCKETDIDLYELETICCLFKKTFRTYHSRYCGFTNDAVYEEMCEIEKQEIFKDVDLSLFYEYRIQNNIPINHIQKERYKETPEQKIKFKECKESLDDF